MADGNTDVQVSEDGRKGPWVFETELDFLAEGGVLANGWRMSIDRRSPDWRKYAGKRVRWTLEVLD